jgi:hypothetical protein
MRNAAREAVKEGIRGALLAGKKANGRLMWDETKKSFYLDETN